MGSHGPEIGTTSVSARGHLGEECNCRGTHVEYLLTGVKSLLIREERRRGVAIVAE